MFWDEFVLRQSCDCKTSSPGRSKFVRNVPGELRVCLECESEYLEIRVLRQFGSVDADVHVSGGPSQGPR